MKRVFFTAPLLLFAVGCAPYVAAQSGLVMQARRGIELARSNSAGHSAAVDELAKLKRQRLDEAFDADVRDRGLDLSAEWVIEHRAAYAAALEAHAQQRFGQARSDETARRNLDAVDAALQRLHWLNSMQAKWTQPIQKEEK